MKQKSLASQGVFEKYGRKSRREQFLDEMEAVLPCSAMESLVRPHCAKAGNGRQPVGLSIMLRTYFVQQWFNLSDPGVEEALYESAALRRFVGVNLGVAPGPAGHKVLSVKRGNLKSRVAGYMVPKFLIDECLSPDLAALARERGFSHSSHVTWLGKAGWKDWDLKRFILK